MIGIEKRHRPLGTYICGNPGSGKSSLIQHMVLTDIRNNQGVCVIDPTADLITTLINYIPEHRVKDVIYFDTTMPISIDFFSYNNDPKEKENLVDDLVAIFDLENAPRAKPFLISVINTLFEAREKGLPTNFLDVYRFCKDEKRRTQILSRCSPERQFQFDRLPQPDTVDAVASRMIPFVESKTLREIVGCHEPKLKLWEVMQKKQILLVNLEDTATDLFIGSLIVSKIQQATFRRRKIENEAHRLPFYLYIDECQTVLKFAVSDFEKILTRARKYNLSLILANQLPSDLPEPIQRKLGTIGNLVIFNLEEGRIFKSRIAPYIPDYLIDLPKFQAIFRTNNKVTKVQTPSFLPKRMSPHVESIKIRTLQEYACKTMPIVDTSGHEAPTNQPDDAIRAPNPHGVLPREDHGGRANPQKKKPDQKRHPDTKSDP